MGLSGVNFELRIQVNAQPYANAGILHKTAKKTLVTGNLQKIGATVYLAPPLSVISKARFESERP